MDVRGQLEKLVTGGVDLTTRGYDDGGRMTSSVYDNGVSESRTYNVDNTPAAINFSGASIGNLSYTWDDNHNKTSETITGTMSGYGFTATYDAEDRLTGWDRADAALDQSWNLTPVGDWQNFTENSVVQNRTHGPAHELAAASGQSVQHDAKGNITLLPSSLRPQPSSFSWDFDNRLKSADVNNNGTIDVEYAFDALGRRVARTEGAATTVFVQNGQQTLADYDSGASPNSPQYTYIWGDYIDELVVRDGSGGRRFYHRNAQYSIVALTNSSGTITERYAYDAYGDLTITDPSGTVRTSSADNNRYTYTGREWDQELELYHFRARMYDPKAGRFIGRDPIGYQGSPRNLYRILVGLKDADPSGTAVRKLSCYRSAWTRFTVDTVQAGCGGRISTSYGIRISVGLTIKLGIVDPSVSTDFTKRVTFTCTGPTGVSNGFRRCRFSAAYSTRICNYVDEGLFSSTYYQEHDKPRVSGAKTETVKFKMCCPAGSGASSEDDDDDLIEEYFDDDMD